jgi:hypothetical protein
MSRERAMSWMSKEETTEERIPECTSRDPSHRSDVVVDD